MTTTDGIEGLDVETRNYGATPRSGHRSGSRRRAGEDGSALWAHRPGARTCSSSNSTTATCPDLTGRPPPRTPRVRPDRTPEFIQPFEPQHWGVLQAIIADPDVSAA